MSRYFAPLAIYGHVRDFMRTTSQAAVAVYYDAPWRRDDAGGA